MRHAYHLLIDSMTDCLLFAYCLVIPIGNGPYLYYSRTLPALNWA